MKRPLDTASSGHRAQNQLAMNDPPRCLKTCIAPAAGANHKMPSGEGKKELWRRDHTLRRWAAKRPRGALSVGRQLPVLGPALVGGLWWLGFNLSVAVAVTTPWPEEVRDDATDNDPCPDRDVPTVPDVAD